MVSPGSFRLLLSLLLGVPEKTIALFDRLLRTEGLRSKSGRGASAARITARDAANLLTAVLASDNIARAAEFVRLFAETRPLPRLSAKKLYAATGLASLVELPTPHSFIDALEALIGSAVAEVQAMPEAPAGKRAPRAAHLPPVIEVAIVTPGIIGDIRLAGLASHRSVAVRYALPSPFDGPGTRTPKTTELLAWEADVRQRRGDIDLEQYRRITAKTIRRVAMAIATTEE